MSHSTIAAIRRTLPALPTLAALLAFASPTPVLAQGPVYYACYVPFSGTVYRIKEPELPTECGTSKKNGVTVQHVEFSWSPGVNDHGNLAGLGDDDHPQYMLVDGTRNATNGFAIAGTLGTGMKPTAPFNRPLLMWYPGKAAFRAGSVNDDQWDDLRTGAHSMALGQNVTASGAAAIALGRNALASGDESIALYGLASGQQSFAVDGTASGDHAVAIGQSTLASGNNSMALGRQANTNGKMGAFVWGDASSANPVNAVASNQFVARAAHFWFGNDNSVTSSLGRFIETSTGAFLSSGGTWTNSSDANRKTAFHDVDAEALLDKVASLPIRTWSYRDEAPSVRHLGPTAQDFRAAFGLGSTDKAIATVDADGVSLAAIQALEKRTAQLKLENDALRAELRALADRLDSLIFRSSSSERQ